MAAPHSGTPMAHGRPDRMTENLDWIARAGTRAKGRRPDYFEDPALDRTVSILMAVVAEVSVVKDRLDTIERLLEQKGSINRADIETYAPDRDAAYERALGTKDYIARVLRGVQQHMESMEVDEPSLEDVTKELEKLP